MKRVLVQYKVKAERAAENEAHIQKVFEELQSKGPEGLRYASFKQEDGVSFVHIASIETGSGANPLAETQAFKEFQAELRDRCDEPPVAVDLTEIGAYRMFES